MATKTRVKVKTAELRRVLVKRREEIIANHKKATEALPERQAAHLAAVIGALEATLARARAGKLPKLRYGGQIEIAIKVAEPVKPTLDTCQVDRLIKMLDMAADDSLVISQEDAAAYFGPCKVRR